VVRDRPIGAAPPELGETGYAALDALAILIARVYERLILERKSAIE
jgi:hypothetical protein